MKQMKMMGKFELPAGATLCAVGGTPVDVHFFGAHTMSDIGPVALAVGLVAGAALWMFNRWGTATERGLDADSAALWSELDQLAEEPREPVGT